MARPTWWKVASLAAGLASSPVAAAPGVEAAAEDELAYVALAAALPCADARPRAAADARPAPAGEAELVARVRAQALGFAEIPDPGRTFPAGLVARIACTAERVNLPARPAKGVVYENVEIRLTIRAAPDDLAALLAAAREAARRVLVVPATRR
jgi:hypothetical protein